MQIHIQFNRLLIGKAFLSGSNFIILILLSNFYPSALPGEYYYHITVVSTIAVFLSLGADNSLFYFVKKNLLSLAGLMGIAWKLSGAFFIATAILLILFYLDIFEAAPYYIFSGAYIFSLLQQNILNAHFSGNTQGWKLQVVNVVINISFLISIAADILFKGTGSLEVLLYGFYTISFIVIHGILFGIHFTNRVKENKPPAEGTFKKIIGFGIMPYLSSSIFFLGANIDLFFIKILCNPKLTVYVQAARIFQMICSVTYLIYYPFMGKILTSTYRNGIEILLRTGRIVIAGLLILLVPFYTMCYFFLDVIFPENTKDILHLLMIFSVSIIATSIAYLYTSYFVAMKKYRQNLISAFIFLTTVTFLCSILIPRMGVYGGAVAYSAAILFSLVFDMLYIVRSINGKFTDALFLKKEDIKNIKSIFRNAV